jgi:hypothetical protein
MGESHSLIVAVIARRPKGDEAIHDLQSIWIASLLLAMTKHDLT